MAVAEKNVLASEKAKREATAQRRPCRGERKKRDLSAERQAACLAPQGVANGNAQDVQSEKQKTSALRERPWRTSKKRQRGDLSAAFFILPPGLRP